MKHPQLKVEERKVLGKEVKKLRREGILPANVYGKELKSVSIQLPLKEFQTVYKEVGETGLIDLMLDGQRRPVLIKSMHMVYPERIPLHVDFYQVNLKEKVKAMIPLTVVGEPVAVTEKVGILLNPLTEVEVEALPEELPEEIEVNVEKLAAIDEQITVGDLKLPTGVTLLSDPAQTVAKIAELAAPEPEPEPEAETPAEGEAAADGGAPSEGEAATEAPAEKSEE